jgi:hypothetical protein
MNAEMAAIAAPRNAHKAVIGRSLIRIAPL